MDVATQFKHGWHLEEYVLKISSPRNLSKNPPAYLDFNAALRDAEENYPRKVWDPFAPDTEIAKLLWRKISDTVYHYGHLAIYPAIGRALDFHHGVDFFFKLNGQAIATVDLCLFIKERYKADFLLTAEQVHNDEALRRFVQNVSSLLIKRSQQHSD